MAFPNVSSQTMDYIMRSNNPLETFREVNISRVAKGKEEIPYNYYSEYIRIYLDNMDFDLGMDNKENVSSHDRAVANLVVTARQQRRAALQRKREASRREMYLMRQFERQESSWARSPYWSEDYISYLYYLDSLTRDGDRANRATSSRRTRRERNRRAHARNGNRVTQIIQQSTCGFESDGEFEQIPLRNVRTAFDEDHLPRVVPVLTRGHGVYRLWDARYDLVADVPVADRHELSIIRRMMNRLMHALNGNIVFSKIPRDAEVSDNFTTLINHANPLGEHNPFFEASSTVIFFIYDLIHSKNCFDVYRAFHRLRVIRNRMDQDDELFPEGFGFDMPTAVRIYELMNSTGRTSSETTEIIMENSETQKPFLNKIREVVIRNRNKLVKKLMRSKGVVTGELKILNPLETTPEDLFKDQADHSDQWFNPDTELFYCNECEYSSKPHLMRECESFYESIDGRGIQTQSETVTDKKCDSQSISEKETILQYVFGSMGLGADMIREFLFKTLNSELFIKIRDLILAFVSLRFFDKDVSKAILMWFGLSRSYTVFDLVTTMLDVLAALFRVGYQLVSGVPMHEILFSPTPVSSLLTKMNQLLYYKDKLVMGLPLEGSMTCVNFIYEADALLKVGSEMVKTLNPTLPNTIDLRSKLIILREAIYNAEQTLHGQRRPMPFCVQLCGPPGIGKSSVFNIICEVWCAINGTKFSMDRVYHVNSDEKFYEGLSRQDIYHYSEVGNLAESIARTRGDPVVFGLCSTADPLPRLAPMAFGDKGKIWINPGLIVNDTNNWHMNLKCMVANSAAILRRFLFVEPHVKPEYRVAGGINVDTAKVIASGVDPFDIWNFKVWICVPKSKDDYTEITLMSHLDDNSDVRALVALLTERMEKHVLEQEVIKRRVESLDISQYMPEGFQSKKEVENEVQFDPHVDPPISQLEVSIREPITSALYTAEAISRHMRSQMFFETVGGMTKADYLATREGYDWNTFEQDEDVKEIQTEANLFSTVKPSIVNYVDYIKQLSLAHFASIGTYLVISYLGTMPQFDIRWAQGSVILNLLCILLCLLFRFDNYLIYIFISFCVLLLSVFNILLKRQVKIALLQFFENVKRKHDIKISYLTSGETEGPDVHALQTDKHRIRWYSWYTYAIMALCSAAGITYMAYRLFRKNPVPQANKDVEQQVVETQAWFDFLRNIPRSDDKDVAESVKVQEIPKPDVNNSLQAELNKLEDSICATDIYTRRKNKLNPLVWNHQEKFVTHLKHTGSLEDLGRKYYKNLRYCLIQNENTKEIKGTYAFGLCRNFAVINKHALPMNDSFTVCVAAPGIKLSHMRNGALSRFIYNGSQLDDVKIVSEDVVVLRLSGVNFADALQHVMDFPLEPGVYESWDLFGGDGMAYKTNDQLIFNDTHWGKIATRSAISYPNRGAEVGDCGKPLLLRVSNRCAIVGIHSGSYKSESFACTFDRMTVEKAIDIMVQQDSMLNVVSSSNMTVVNEEKVAFTESVTFTQLLTDISGKEPHAKNFSHYEILDNVRWIGYTGLFNRNGKSHLTKTRGHILIPSIIDDCMNNPEITEYGPPLMGEKRVNGEYINPINIGVRKLCRQKKALDRNILRRCVDELVGHITSGLSSRGVAKDWKPWSLNAAINSPEFDEYSRPINTKTAAGFGLTGKKSQYFDEVFKDGKKYRKPSRKIVEMVLDIYSKYKNHETAGTVFNGSLKDEARSLDKVASGKTRMFYAGATPDLLVNRMLLGPIHTSMQEHSDLYCTAIGIDASKPVNRLVEELSEMDDPDLGQQTRNKCEWDYSGFDVSMPWDLGWAAASVIYRVCKFFGYPKQALDMVEALLTDLLFPIVHVDGVLLEVPGLQPSGKYGTAEDNSLRNLLMIMYMWYHNKISPYGTFFQNIRLRVYGDDCVGAPHYTLVDKFNNYTFRDFCKEHYGIDVTPAAKGDEMQEAMRLEDISFLKRKFVYTQDYDSWLMPINADSIAKSLMWFIPSDVETSANQHLGAIRSALFELVPFVSRDKYERFKASMIGILVEFYKVPRDQISLFSYDDILRSKGLIE